MATAPAKRSPLGAAMYRMRVSLALNMLSPSEEVLFYCAVLLVVGLVGVGAFHVLAYAALHLI